MKVVAIQYVGGSVAMGVTEVENELSAMQNFVGGYIEAVEPFADYPEIVCVCDEEGRLKGKPVTVSFDWVDVCGSCFFCESNEEGDFVELREEYIQMLLNGAEGE